MRRPRRSDPAPAPPKQAALFNVLSARWIVIEGFRIEMAAQELIGYLRDRARTIATPPSNATGDARAPPRRRAGWIRPIPTNNWVPCGARAVGELDEYAAEHRRREAAFVFPRDHVPRTRSIASTGPT